VIDDDPDYVAMLLDVLSLEGYRSIHYRTENVC